MDNFSQEFQIESGGQLDAILHDLSELKSGIDHGPTRRTLVGNIFRKIHTLKGAASTAGYESTARIAQAAESLLDRVRTGELILNPEIFETLSSGVLAIVESLQAGPETVALVRADSVVEELRRAKNRSVPDVEASIHSIFANLPTDVARSLSAPDRQRLRENISEGAHIAILSIALELDSFDDKFRELSVVLNECGEVLSTLPGIEAGFSETINFRILHATTSDPSLLAGRMQTFGECLIFPIGEEPEADDFNSEAPWQSSDLNQPTVDAGWESEQSDLVPVSSSDLNNFVAEADEIVRASLFVVKSILSSGNDVSTAAAFQDHAYKIQERFDRYKELAHLIRTTPIERTFARAELVGKSAARQTGKSIEIHFEPTDIRVHTGLAKTINDCLLHLMNNAVFHGIEDDTSRLNAGKALPGQIELRAGSRDGNISISITDDGAGLDLEKISRVAFELGLVAEKNSLSEEEYLGLITRPGFTTSDSVSRVAGRGVGLDAVKDLVAGKSGTLQMKTRPGLGTTFEMTFGYPESKPLTAGDDES